MPASQAELQEAVYDLHQYLSDHKAPLMVADSVALLLQYPPEFFAEQLHAWVSAQAVTAPVSDYLYHGAKKLALMGDFELVPREALAKYLGDLGTVLVQLCPEADRQILKQNLERLGHEATATVAAAGVLHRQSGVQTSPQPEAATAPPEQALSREMRRLSLLLEHLRPLASAPPEQRAELASQFMSAAAMQSKSVSELEQHLAPLRQFGIETGTEQVFRMLASSLPGWALPSVAGQGAAAVSGEQLKAMSQIVSLAEDPAEVAKRFREMVHAAIEQFNEGHLGRAATMFELAERMVAEQKIKPVFVDALRTQGHEYLDQERLKKLAAREDNRARLRPILSFFNALQPLGLLKSLDGEPSRERRHQLLALLEAHEQAARKAAWDLLQASVEEGAQVDPFFQMNLVYLLRVVPRQEAPIEPEVNAVMRASGRSSPPPLIKQIIAYLAHSRHEKAERALITYLKVFESMLLQPETAVYPPQEVEVLLDRTCAALARYGSPRAWRLLIDHGLKSEARLGSPFLRLGEAGRLDFSKNKDLVERVITALRAELPKGGVLGFGGKGNEDKAVALIQALAGTPLPEVRTVLQEIASKYPGKKLEEAATKALETLASAAKPAPPPAGLTGDLELFGLPNLLQTFGQTQVSGVFSLMNADGKPQASLLFEMGHFRGGHTGSVLGEEAVYQLLERPFPGTFAFVSRTDVATQPNVGPPIEIFPLLMEGVRRHDEFKVAAAVAPDAMALKPTGKPHTPLAEEDPAFAGRVWEQASGGKTPLQCEAVIKADAYRVRRLIAHWMEEGALQKA